MRRVEPNCPGAAGDQDVAAFQRSIGEQGEIRGHRGHAEACTGLESRASRKRHGLRGRQGDVFRRRSESAAALRIPEPYLLANARFAHAFANGVDLARTVAVRDDERIPGPVARTAAAIAVRRVDSGEADAHAHFPGAWLRVRQLADLQYLSCRAVLREIGRLHGSTRSLAAVVRADVARASAISRQRRQAARWSGSVGSRSGTMSAHWGAA